MKALFIEEPELEFGVGGRHIDVRHGLIQHGPLDRGQPTAPKVVRLGIIGDLKSIEAFRGWVDRCREGVEGKASPHRSMYPPFPGFGDGRPLSDFVLDDRLVHAFARSDVRHLEAQADRRVFADELTERFVSRAADLFEHANADVVACLLSPEAIRRIDVPDRPDAGPRSAHRPLGAGHFVWHDLFKARALSLGRPVQVVRPATYGAGVWKYRRSGQAVTALQDEATRAWNLFCALYYKAGGVPWRLVRDATDFTACYVGIGFYVEGEPSDESEDKRLRTSVAQVFNERGEGMIVRGGRARIDPNDRTPHLSAEDMRALIEKAVEAYRREHRTLPARLVCHKSTLFNEAEVEGCEAAADALNIDGLDLLSMRSSHTRLFRAGTYSPLRGTALVEESGRRCFLFTQGSVDFYRCYPGLYVPRTLEVRRDATEQGELALLSELLALTKMNWNNTGLVNAEPVTLAAAKRVGGVLKHVPNDVAVQARYSLFM